MRVFIAIDISQEAKKEIKKVLKELQKKHWPVRWIKPDNLHITLAFIADIKKEKIQLLKSICQKVSQDICSFEFSFKGLGCFPDYDWPRVVWLGLKGDLQSLASLQKKLQKQLVKEGLLKGENPFSPHLTLGRIKRARGRQRREIGRQLKGLRILDLKSKVLVDKILVYQSNCLASGPVYQKLAEAKLLVK